jgi:NADPH:quinone reductase-like Zn-dependent oxidoreductase
MRAMAIDGFGGPEALTRHVLPVPAIGDDEVLVRVEYAGVGEWDPFEREGGYARMLGTTPAFPYVLGSEGAGAVVAVGAAVRRFSVGDRVWAVGFLNPRGGFYAEYAAVAEDLVSPLPRTLTAPQEAAALGGVGLTALRGLDDVLRLMPGEALLVFGASGGVGHVAVQLARRMGARVLAVASGEDGVELSLRLGAEAAVDGHRDDVLRAARAFAPEGLDAALLTAGGDAAERALDGVRAGGRAAFPNGVYPAPAPRGEVQITGYNGEPERDVLERLRRWVECAAFSVQVARTFPLEDAAEAHRTLGHHYLGKLVLRVV